MGSKWEVLGHLGGYRWFWVRGRVGSQRIIGEVRIKCEVLFLGTEAKTMIKRTRTSTSLVVSMLCSCCFYLDILFMELYDVHIENIFVWKCPNRPVPNNPVHCPG